MKAALNIIVVFIVIAAALFGLRIRQKGWAQWQHERVMQRINRHLVDAMHAMPVGSGGLSGPELGRYEMLRTFQSALFNNPMHHHSLTVPEKFRAIADRLDDNDGADLKTCEGCVVLLLMFDKASPTFHEFTRVTTLYEMSAEGSIPPLPALGQGRGKAAPAARGL